VVRYLGAEGTGITEGVGQGEFLLAPNPATSQVMLTPKTGDAYTLVMCYDALGRNVLSTDARGGTTIDVSTWPAGAYMVATLNTRGTMLSVKRLLVHH
jgi:hypothetical protein